MPFSRRDFREMVAAVIRVCIVEDNVELREEFCRLVDDTEGLTRAGDYEKAEDAIRDLAANAPDVVLMDIQLAGIDGVEGVRRLKKVAPNVQVVMLTIFESNDWIFDALRAGAGGYVLKRASRSEIVDAIRQIHEGGAPMSSSVARKVVRFFSQQQPQTAALDRLTDRETDVLTKLSEGLSYDEIATALAISINTVRKHIRSIYEKLEVRSGTEAVGRYLRG